MHYFLKIISEQPYISGIRRKINTCVTWNNWIQIIPNLVNIPEDSDLLFIEKVWGNSTFLEPEKQYL